MRNNLGRLSVHSHSLGRFFKKRFSKHEGDFFKNFLEKGPLRRYFLTRKVFEKGMWHLKIRYFFSKRWEFFENDSYFFEKGLELLKRFFFFLNGQYNDVFWKTYASENSGYFLKDFWKTGIFFWKRGDEWVKTYSSKTWMHECATYISRYMYNLNIVTVS